MKRGAVQKKFFALRKGTPGENKTLRTQPQILIFDVDGVLVDVRGTYWRSALETVRYLTGKRVTYAELHEWKSKPGFNDDWSMVAAWVTALGKPISYDQARVAFEKFYWGTDGKLGSKNGRGALSSICLRGERGRSFRSRLNAGQGRNISARLSPWMMRRKSRIPRACG